MQEIDGPVALTPVDGDTKGSLWQNRQHQFREIAPCAGSTMESNEIQPPKMAGDAGQHRVLGGLAVLDGCDWAAPRALSTIASGEQRARRDLARRVLLEKKPRCEPGC
jgi:hypothetical protein